MFSYFRAARVFESACRNSTWWSLRCARSRKSSETPKAEPDHDGRVTINQNSNSARIRRERGASVGLKCSARREFLLDSHFVSTRAWMRVSRGALRSRE